MKAISLWQPWASLIACEAKPFETRSWAPPRDLIGQPIAIHAAKKVDKDAAIFATELSYGQNAIGGFDLANKLELSWGGDESVPGELMAKFGSCLMPVGCVVAIARLDAAFQLGEIAKDTAVPGARVVRRITSRDMPECFTVRIDDFGDYSPGRWAWLLRDVKPLKPPVAAKGAQGFFELPQGWLTAGDFPNG